MLELDIVDCGKDEVAVLDLVRPDEFLRRPEGAGLADFAGSCELVRGASAGDSIELISIPSTPASIARL